MVDPMAIESQPIVKLPKAKWVTLRDLPTALSGERGQFGRLPSG